MENVTQIVVKPGDLHAGVKTRGVDFYRIDVVIDVLTAGYALATVILAEDDRVTTATVRHNLPSTWKILWTS